MALNRIVLQGRLTKDPELRFTPAGKAVGSFSLAVDRDFKDKDGEKGVDFIEIIVWGNAAEFVSKHFTKGQAALVEGRLQVRDWIDKEGNKRRSAEVNASGVYFCGPKAESGAEPANRAGNDFREIPDDNDGDLPF
jgi:single-strand DNA-binding protein